MTRKGLAGMVGLMVLLLCAQGRAELGVTLSEDAFDGYTDTRPLSTRWRCQGGTFALDDGALHIASSKQNPICTLKQDLPKDASFAVRLRQADASHKVGIVAKKVYWLRVSRETSSLNLEKIVDGKVQPLGRFSSYPTYVWNPGDFIIRLDVVGDTLRAYLDGKQVIEASDAEAATRSGGLKLVGGWGTDTWFDDVLVRGVDTSMPPQPAQPRARIDLVSAQVKRPELALAPPHAVYYDAEKVTVAAQLQANVKSGFSHGELAVRFDLIDWQGRSVWRQNRSITLPQGSAITESVTFTPPKNGAFKLRLTEADPLDRQLPPPYVDLITLAVIPRRVADLSRDSRSPFGGHPWQQDGEIHQDLARRMGSRWVRTHDFMQATRWVWVEPAQDEWHWFDTGMDGLIANRQHVLGTFLKTPPWLAKNGNQPPLSSGPDPLIDFKDYVRHTVAHFKDRVNTWEVWNEPHVKGFWSGSAEQYAQLCQAAYAVVKQEDPSATVVGGGGVSPGVASVRPWIERAFAAGLNDCADVFSIHYKGTLRGPFPESVRDFQRNIAWMKELMRKHGAEKPLWNSETGIHSTSFIDRYRRGVAEQNAPYHVREAAGAMMRLYVLHLAAGVDKAFYYYLAWVRKKERLAQLLERPLDTNLVDVGGGLKPMGVAYATAADHLTGRPFARRVDLSPTVSAYLFADPERQQVAAVYWGMFGRDPGTRFVHLPEWGGDAVQVFDLMNNAHRVQGRAIVLSVSRIPTVVRFSATTVDQVASWWQGAELSDSPEPRALAHDDAGPDGGHTPDAGLSAVLDEPSPLDQPTPIAPAPGGGGCTAASTPVGAQPSVGGLLLLCGIAIVAVARMRRRRALHSVTVGGCNSAR